MNRQRILLVVLCSVMFFTYGEDTDASSLLQNSHPGFLMFTDLFMDYSRIGFTVDVFDLEQGIRSSLPYEVLNEQANFYRIDYERVFVLGCFGRSVRSEPFCAVYINDIISPDDLGRYDVLLDSWQVDYGSPNWSPDGNYIAFSAEHQNSDNPSFRWNVFVMDADGTNSRDLIPETDSDGWQEVWSPDSQRIAFPCYEDLYLCIVSPDGSDLQRLIIPENMRVRDFAWSPDSRQLVLSLNNNDITTRHYQLYVAEIDTSRFSLISESTTDVYFNLNWAPDGSRILYGTNGLEGGEVFVIEPDGTNLQNISQTLHGHEFGAVWSPDSTHVAFFSDQYSEGVFLYTANVDGTDLQRITTNSIWGTSDHGVPELYWLPELDEG